MKSKLVILCGVVLLLGGCQSTAGPKYAWARNDGQIIGKNKSLMLKFDTDRTICQGHTQQSAAGMAPIYYRGIGGAIDAAIIQQQRQAVLEDVAKGCMAQRGYRAVPVPQTTTPTH